MGVRGRREEGVKGMKDEKSGKTEDSVCDRCKKKKKKIIKSRIKFGGCESDLCKHSGWRGGLLSHHHARRSPPPCITGATVKDRSGSLGRGLRGI